MLVAEIELDPSTESLAGIGSPVGEITSLLVQLNRRDGEDSRGRLIPMIYSDLRRLAFHFMRGERAGHTLQPTVLVHEAILRLTGGDIHWQNRKQFFATAGLVMRRVLVDHARRRQRRKRSDPQLRNLALSNWRECTEADSAQILALDQALVRLERLDPRQCRLVELRFFAGLSVEETASVMELSPTTVKREWGLARAWLFGQLGGDTL